MAVYIFLYLWMLVICVAALQEIFSNSSDALAFPEKISNALKFPRDSVITPPCICFFCVHALCITTCSTLDSTTAPRFIYAIWSGLFCLVSCSADCEGGTGRNQQGLGSDNSKSGRYGQCKHAVWKPLVLDPMYHRNNSKSVLSCQNDFQASRDTLAISSDSRLG